MNKIAIAFLGMLSMVSLSATGLADMSSTNYRISTTVISGGGAPMASTNYQMNGTLGQPSPLMEQGMDPYSDNNRLLPIFWYTLAGMAPICECDLDHDGDRDMFDYYLFGEDWGRMDCP